jgi:hypothetical protein
LLNLLEHESNLVVFHCGEDAGAFRFVWGFIFVVFGGGSFGLFLLLLIADFSPGALFL